MRLLYTALLASFRGSFLFLLAGCATQHLTPALAREHEKNREFYADEFSNNRTVNLILGDVLVINLSNHNGGQSSGIWQPQGTPEPVLVYRYPPGSSSFVYTATAEGSELVSFASLPGNRGAFGASFNLRVNVVASAIPYTTRR